MRGGVKDCFNGNRLTRANRNICPRRRVAGHAKGAMLLAERVCDKRLRAHARGIDALNHHWFFFVIPHGKDAGHFSVSHGNGPEVKEIFRREERACAILCWKSSVLIFCTVVFYDKHKTSANKK